MCVGLLEPSLGEMVRIGMFFSMVLDFLDRTLDTIILLFHGVRQCMEKRLGRPNWHTRAMRLHAPGLLLTALA